MTVECDQRFTTERIHILWEHQRETCSVLKVGDTLPEEATLGLHKKDDDQLARHRIGKGTLLNIWDVIPARVLSCQAPSCPGSLHFSSTIPHTSLQLSHLARPRLQRKADITFESPQLRERDR